MEEFVIYKKDNGVILGVYDHLQTLQNIFHNSTIEEINKEVSTFHSQDIPYNFRDYKVVNNEFVMLSDIEKREILRFGTILDEYERTLESLKPHYKEIQKAENTIEILTLIQEVL